MDIPKTAEFLKNLVSSRTVISLLVSMILKLLAAKRVIGATSQADTENITTFIITMASFGADGLGIWFRLKATVPGALTPQFAARQAWIKSGEHERRSNPQPEQN